MLLLAASAIAVLALAWPKASVPKLYWNVSPSVPAGLYMLRHQVPAKGQLALIRLPESARIFAAARGYLPANALLIKSVVAAPDDTVCRHGPFVTINGRLRAIAGRKDARLRVLPRWHGCHRLTTSELFVLSSVRGSFDGRYLGPIEHGNVLGTAAPIWVR